MRMHHRNNSIVVLLLWLLCLAAPAQRGEAHVRIILTKIRGGGQRGGEGRQERRGRFSSFFFFSNDKSKNKSKNKSKTNINRSQPQSKHKTNPKEPFVLSRKWARILYSLTALNPALAVLFNDYTKTLRFFRRWRISTQPHALARTYETLFFFARFKPRVSFAIGAMLRALQLNTALQCVFDPVVGIGLGLDLLSFFCHSTWPATVVLGWSLTEPIWKALGARPPATSPVPISIAMITAASPNYSAKQQQSSSSSFSSSSSSSSSSSKQQSSSSRSTKE